MRADLPSALVTIYVIGVADYRARRRPMPPIGGQYLWNAAMWLVWPLIVVIGAVRSFR